MKKLVFLLVVAFAVISCGRQTQEQSQSQSQSVTQIEKYMDDCDEAVQIATLTERGAWLEKENAELQMRLDE